MNPVTENSNKPPAQVIQISARPDGRCDICYKHLAGKELFTHEGEETGRHGYCGPCLTDYLERGGGRSSPCPTCRRPIDPSGLRDRIELIETARANVIGYAALGTFLVAITVAQITTAIMKGSVDLTRRDMREAVMVADVMVALAVPVTAAAAIVAQALAKLDVEFGVRRTVVEEVVKVATRVVAFSVMGMGVAAVAGPAIRNLGVAAAAGVAAVATVGRLIEVGRRRIYEDYRAE